MKMVFQSYILFPHRNVSEYIDFGLKMRKVNAADRRRRPERAAELQGLLHRKPAELPRPAPGSPFLPS